MSSLKHQILYAEHEWRQQRLWAAILIVGGLIFSYQELATHVKGPSWAVYLPFAYAPAGLLFGLFALWRRRRQQVQARDDGLYVGKTFSSYLIPYEDIRTARVLPLRQVAQPDGTGGGRKRYLAPPVKANLDTPSLVLRLEGAPEQIAAHRKALGPRHVFEGSAAFPITDPDGAVKEIASHLPEGSGQNLGGARRRGKRRR